ncbi:NAD-dependent malic enzyme [[Clostridium] innocuum]|nr:NAD-dependent malic enzyme [[Clostridium] innocuum]MCR0577191.1 NAD-dependent malic enzyme [[Clostridium] innocuum]
MDYAKEALRLHAEWKGKLDINPKMEINTKDDLSLAYTPGVATPCLEIEKDINKSYELTGRGNLVAVVTDGTAVLGLGDIGPEAGMPVMEGKCVLFKEFGGVNAVPLCIKSKDVDEIVHTVALLSGSFGGINLEDIAAPRCFEIEAKLKELCDIPVFHDDQHGTAIVTAAALLNAVKLTGKKMGNLRIVINGAGSAGIAIARLLLKMNFGDVILCDSKGSVYKGREGMNAGKKEIAELTNKGLLKGSLADAMKGSDIFIGVSAPDVVSEAMVASMNEKSIVLPMANPVPEIMPDKAKHAGAFVVGTGRSDFANQINNVLAFPGIFRGALDVRASDINEEMKVAAAYAIASLVRDEELSVDYIIPSALNKEVGAVVAKAVAQAARDSGVARI